MFTAWRSVTSENRNEEETNTNSDVSNTDGRKGKIHIQTVEESQSNWINCEQEMELIRNNLTDKDKIDFVSKHF